LLTIHTDGIRGIRGSTPQSDILPEKWTSDNLKFAWRKLT